MPVSARQGKGLATLLGAACLLLAAAPASQAFTYTGEINESGAYILGVEGNATSESLQMKCTGGKITVNGFTHFSSLLGHTVGCDEADIIYMQGNEGDDRLDTSLVSFANGFRPIDGCCDAPQAPSDAVDLVGNEGRDTLIGGPFGESINYTNSSGEQGPDTVKGGGGNDEIYGTDDDDNLFGDAGQDILYPQLGKDTVHGGAAHDAIDDVIFAKDRDVFFGEGGGDQLFGGAGGDLIDGGPGNDYMDGQGGKDRMLGRAGSDGLFGRGGADFLFGHAGNDYIRGGPAFDHIFPGPGNDDVRQ